MSHLIPIVEKAFKNAEQNSSKIDEGILSIDGMSGAKTRHFYNNLISCMSESGDTRYLEIGTWRGSTVCAAMCNNNATVICIDNWCEFGGPKEEFLTNFNRYKGSNKAFFIENDCFKIDISILPKFNIYLYDGGHSYQEHYNALVYYYNTLEDEFIYMVDDWNWNWIRDATRKVISDLQLQVVYDREIRITYDNSVSKDKEGWWNGIAVFILKKTR